MTDALALLHARARGRPPRGAVATDWQRDDAQAMLDLGRYGSYIEAERSARGIGGDFAKQRTMSARRCTALGAKRQLHPTTAPGVSLHLRVHVRCPLEHRDQTVQHLLERVCSVWLQASEQDHPPHRPVAMWPHEVPVVRDDDGIVVDRVRQLLRLGVAGAGSLIRAPRLVTHPLQHGADNALVNVFVDVEPHT